MFILLSVWNYCRASFPLTRLQLIHLRCLETRTELRKRLDGSVFYVRRMLHDLAISCAHFYICSLCCKIIRAKGSPTTLQQHKAICRALRSQNLSPKNLFTDASKKENSGIVDNLGNDPISEGRIVLQVVVKEGFPIPTMEDMMKFEVTKALLRMKYRDVFLAIPSPTVLRRALLKTKNLSVLAFNNRQVSIIVSNTAVDKYL